MEINLGKLLAVGSSAEVYEYGKDNVIKLYNDNFGEGTANFEYQKTKNAWENNLPAPRTYGLIKHNNRFGFIMERIYGNTMNDEIVCFVTKSEGIPFNDIFYSEQITGRIKNTAKILHNIHRTQANLIDTAEATIKRTIDMCDILTQDEKTVMFDILYSLPKYNRVCHGDPNFNNFIETIDGYRLVDWMNSVTGNPMFDLGWYKAMLSRTLLSSSTPDWVNIFFEQYKDKMFDIFLDEYKALSNIDILDLDKWTLLLSTINLTGSGNDEQKLIALREIQNRLKMFL